MRMIKLDYGVLAMLTQGDMSGYDITTRLNKFWKTTHSRVYPVLNKLEKLEYARYWRVEQSNKPDKKVYRITEKGEEALKEWLLTATTPSAKKDEALLKLTCVHLLGKDVIIGLLEERIEFIKKERKEAMKIISQTRSKCGGVLTDTSSHLFNAHVLTEILLAQTALEKEWCEWVVGLYKMKNVPNFFDIKFKSDQKPGLKKERIKQDVLLSGKAP